jgi:hypothetical protein
LVFCWDAGNDLIDECFLLVGSRKPNYYRPERNKRLCVYVGWLLAAALVDAARGTNSIVYPYHELCAVRELGVKLNSQSINSSSDAVIAIMVLAYFEVSMVQRGRQSIY